jgi:snRNA-activating protein complex subunit 3
MKAMSAAGEEIAADEIILSVAQFHPMKNKKHQVRHPSARSLTRSRCCTDRAPQEYLVLGSQPLTALRDKIYCLADKVLEGVSSAPAVFLIEGNTYIDTRSIDPNRFPVLSSRLAECTACSESVTAVCRPLPFSLGEPGIRRMEEALFSSLAVRIGVQYKYIHQGGCEHTIAFTEIR